MSAAVHSLDGPLPVPDRFEPDDDVRLAATVYARAFRGRATLDAWDDPNDVYRIRLRRGQRVSVLVRAGTGLDASLALWKPALRTLAAARDGLRAARSIHPPGAPERIRYRARSAGWYYLQVKVARGSGPYSIRIARS